MYVVELILNVHKLAVYMLNTVKEETCELPARFNTQEKRDRLAARIQARGLLRELFVTLLEMFPNSG